MNLLNHYDRFQALAPGIARGKALDFVRAHALPTRQNEDWKYTSLKFLAEKEFLPAALQAEKPAHENLLYIQKNFASHCANLVFINGRLDKTLSQDLPENVEISETSVEKSEFLDTLEALNALYSPFHYQLTVKRESSVVRPVNLIFWSEGEGVMNSTAVKIMVQTRSNAQFMVSHLSAGQECFNNSVVEMTVADNAKASLIKVQEESLQALHIGLTRIEVGKDAEVENLIFSTGAKLGRNTLQVLLKGEGSTTQIHGVYAVSGNQHVDNNTSIDHLVGHCTSSQLYKGLLDGESRAIFNGKVLIRRNAMKANSEQLNNNLLLSRKAEADSKPMLEIDADDVKASHGSTVGQMNKEELFYLLSRAIPKNKAIPMLSYGFLSEVVYKIGNEQTQKWLSAKLDKVFERISLEQP